MPDSGLSRLGTAALGFLQAQPRNQQPAPPVPPTNSPPAALLTYPTPCRPPRHNTRRKPPRSTLDPKSFEDSSAGMRSRTAVRRPSRKQPPLKEDHRRAFPQVNPGVVGLAGLEPAPSSLSEIDRQALCYPASAQVAPIRTCDKDGVNRRSSAPMPPSRRERDIAQ